MSVNLEYLRNKRVLVTGAAGFIGGHSSVAWWRSVRPSLGSTANRSPIFPVPVTSSVT